MLRVLPVTEYLNMRWSQLVHEGMIATRREAIIQAVHFVFEIGWTMGKLNNT